MKLLRNPWVTGALAVIAVAVVVYQVVAPQRSRRPAPASPASPTAAVAPAPGNPGSRATPALQHSGSGMDRSYIESRFAGWVNVPRRDPFLLFASGPAQKNLMHTNSPLASWKLTGIWNQAGSRLAVINNKVYGVGDAIQGYQVEKIEGDEVWLNGTNGLERLGFQRHRSAAPPSPGNTPPAK